MSDDATKSASAMRNLLEPFHACQQRALTAVLQDDGEAGEAILLVFGTDALFFRSDPDLDTLTVSFGPLAGVEDFADLTADRPWSRFIGKPFFWGWFTINQQGYTDGALVSFDGVLPEVGVTVVASSLETVVLTRVDR